MTRPVFAEIFNLPAANRQGMGDYFTDERVPCRSLRSPRLSFLQPRHFHRGD